MIIFAAIALAIAAIGAIAYPIIRPRLAAQPAEDEGLGEFHSKRENTYLAIEELKFDYEQIRVAADLSTSDISLTPSIQDWTITYYYRQYTSTEPTTGAPGAEESLDYNTSGTIASKVFDTGKAGTTWMSLSWAETLPASTDITFEVRASDTSFLKDAAAPSWTFSCQSTRKN